MTAYLVAQHESRHCLMAMLHGFEVTEVVLAADGDSGRCVYDAPSAVTATPAELRAMMLVALAGHAGDQGEYRAHNDILQASTWYARWMQRTGPAKPFERAVLDLLQECRLLLIPVSAQVQRLANALLASGRLTAEDLADLLPLPRQRARVSSPPRARPAPTPRQTRTIAVPDEEAMIRDTMAVLSLPTLDYLRANRRWWREREGR